MKPQTKRIQSKAKAEGCVQAEQVKAWEADLERERTVIYLQKGGG